VLVDCVEWEVSEDKAEPITQFLPQPFHDRVGSSAIGAFVVAILDKRDRRIGRSGGVVPLGHGEGERGAVLFELHGLSMAVVGETAQVYLIASSAVRIPSAPGFTSIGDR
jgi:hypothetical protein